MARASPGRRPSARPGSVGTGRLVGAVKEIPDRWHELGEFIREQRRLARLSLRRLSELAGISNPYLSQIERGLRKPSAEILQQIARALRISAETLYVRAGILEAREDADDLVARILGDRHLSEDQKHALVRIYLAFRHERTGDEGAAPALPVPEPPVPGAALAGAPAPGSETASAPVADEPLAREGVAPGGPGGRPEEGPGG
jgi:transcriptional regulator with XRE-family HTH domain